MWTTQDGFVLRLSRRALSRAALAIDRCGLRGLVRQNHRGNLRDAVLRSIGKLATQALRTEDFQSARSGRSYAVFLTKTPAGSYEIFARPLADKSFAIVFARKGEGVESEVRVGDDAPVPNQGASANQFHEARIKKIVDQLKRIGYRDIWVDQPQVAGGRDGKVVGLNRPDISAINPRTNERINIEVDTDRLQSARHQAQVVANDPKATSTFIIIDPNTGKVLGSRVYRPSTKLITGSRIYGHRRFNPVTKRRSGGRPTSGPIYDIRTGRRVARSRRAARVR
jgi:hypothetical protein